MAAVTPVPCPVRLGIVKKAGPDADLHKYTVERSLHKMERLLKKGVEVDCVNHLGQTPLFCASLLGLTSAVDLLLQFGADPNHRCGDRSTPVHAAVFSCNPWLLSGLLDAGGDLRLHDHEGRTPRDWAEAGAQEDSQRMLEFLRSCASHMRSLPHSGQLQSPSRTPPRSCRTLLRSPSLLELIRPGGSDLHVKRKKSTISSAWGVVQCYGFGKLRIDGPRQPLGFLASVPMITDTELGQADDEPLLSYTCESFVSMTNYSWKGSRVTVKELQSHNVLKRAAQESYLDLLIIEQEYCCQLFHPHLLQLLAISVCPDMQQTRLVFERVHLGSLHSLLHHRVCDVLLYLHGQGLVLRSLSSHAVQLVHPGVAKITGLGFMVSRGSSEGGSPSRPVDLALPMELYNWAAPEVIRNRTCDGKADLYSLCALIQELYTDTVPWGEVDPEVGSWIKQTVESGQALAADPSVPQPYYQLVRSGLQPRAQDRTNSLQDLRYLLRCDIRELSQAARRGSGLYPCLGFMQSREQGHVKETAGELQREPSNSLLDEEIQNQLSQLDQLLEMETDEEESRRGNRGSGGPREVHKEPTSDSDQASLHREISFRQILPLDDWHLSLCPRPTPDSSQAAGSESSIPEDEMECEWQTASRSPSPSTSTKISNHISSIVLNLKVSQVLLQQANRSLDNVEMAQGGRPVGSEAALPLRQGKALNQVCGERCGTDEVDGMNVCRAARRQDQDTEGSSSAKSEHRFARAVGPPPRYCLLPPGIHPSAQILEAQILQGTSHVRRLTPEELSVWQGVYPPSWAEDLPERLYTSRAEKHPEQQYPSIGEEERSHYSSAREECFVSMHSENVTADRNSVSSGVTVGRGQKAGRDRTYVFSGMSESSENVPRLRGKPDTPSEAKWTSEVSEVVARMTRGHLVATAISGSSESEDMEEGLQAGSRGALSCSDHLRPWQELQEAESTNTTDKWEQLFKSFAGVQTDSEEDSDFQTVNPTLNVTCSDRQGSGQKQEVDSSESDYAQSPTENSSVFFTPNPGVCPQTPSSEEDLEVTMEVCQPAQAIIQSRLWEIQSSMEEPAETKCNPAPFPMASSLPELAELAELSSIKSSPGQSLMVSPLGRRKPPCNSTPCTHAESPRFRAIGGHVEPLPYLPSLLDTSPWNSTPSQPITTETFATASLGTTSSTDPSVSSVLQSPAPGTSLVETGPVTGPHRFTTVSSAKRRTTGASQSQEEAVCFGNAVPDRGQTAMEEERCPLEGEIQTAAAANVSGRTLEETGNEAEDSAADSLSSTSNSEQPPDVGALVACVPVGGKEELLSDNGEMCDEEAVTEKEEMCDEEVITDKEEMCDDIKLADELICPEGRAEHANERGSHLGPRPSAPNNGTVIKDLQTRGQPIAERDILEETERAHSTLDEVLQGMLVEGGAGQRVPRSPGTIILLNSPEGEGNSWACCPEGDNEEYVAVGKMAETNYGASSALIPDMDEQGKQLEIVNQGIWSQPHRVIVLEQTPTKSHSDPNQVSKSRDE